MFRCLILERTTCICFNGNPFVLNLKAFRSLIFCVLLFASSFAYSQKFTYSIVGKGIDSNEVACSGLMEFRISKRTDSFGFYRGKLDYNVDGIKIKSVVFSLPPYEGLEFYDLTLMSRKIATRIIMYDGLYVLYKGEEILGWYVCERSSS